MKYNYLINNRQIVTHICQIELTNLLNHVDLVLDKLMIEQLCNYLDRLKYSTEPFKFDCINCLCCSAICLKYR